MPCHSAMTKNLVTVTQDQTIEDVLAVMSKKKLDAVPVIDSDKKLVGLFSINILLKNLLPVSVSIDGTQNEVSLKAAPGVAKRLKKVGPLQVSELMERKLNLVYPDTPTWEGINYLVQYGPPILVIERETKKLLGVITPSSALDELQRLKDSET